jgi:hypothetical protein
MSIRTKEVMDRMFKGITELNQTALSTITIQLKVTPILIMEGKELGQETMGLVVVIMSLVISHELEAFV